MRGPPSGMLLALYQVSSRTWVRVPGVGAKVRIVCSIRTTLLWKGTSSAVHTARAPVQQRQQGTGASLYFIETLDQTVSPDSCARRGGVVQAHALPPLALGLG